MHYYERNIGDYYKKAGRLNILQHGVYTLLIDACYDREQFPTLEEAIDWVWAETDEEIEAVKFVLRKFFKPDGNGVYVQHHIEQDLIAYQEFLDKQTENGKKGGRPKKTTDSQELAKETQNNPLETQNNPIKPKQSLNQEPLTNNQEPLTNNNNNNSASAIFEIYSDWIPLEPSFSELLADMEIPLSKHTPKTLKDYILHCRAKDPDKQNTQGQWQLFYAKWLQREREPVPQALPTSQPKKTSERHVLGVPISRINVEARPGETEEDCAKRLKNPVGSGESSMNVKLADDRPMFEIYAEKEALRKMAAQAS